jgi:agmatinase
MNASNTSPTFLGVAACDVFGNALEADVVIMGAADCTPHIPGEPSHAAKGPSAIRGVLAKYASDHDRWDFDQDRPLFDNALCRVADHGDLSTDPKAPDANRTIIREATQRILRSGAVPMLLGGDDSVPIPFIEAFEGYGPLTIIQIDAHLDWRDERNGLKHTFSSTMRRASEMAWVTNIVQVGLRGVGGSRRQDLEAARQWGAHLVTAARVQQEGIKPVLGLIPDGARCLVTIDCDGIDPSVLPAVILPQPGGLSYLDVIGILRGVAAKAIIAGFDLVELVPEHDVGGLGVLAASRIVCNALGCVAEQRRVLGRIA